MDLTGPFNRAVRQVPPGTIYALAALWAGWMFWRGLTGGLGPEPVDALERAYGAMALKVLVAGLAVTPARRWLGLNLMPFRRAIGVTAFFLVLAHLLVWAILDVQSLSRVWEDIVKRPYVTVGMASFLLLVPLAATSNAAAIRRLGAAGWRRLHLLTYPAVILGAVHFLWLVRGFPYEPLAWLATIGLLLALRFVPAAREKAARRAG